MKIWLRVHGYEPCSWTFVWQNLSDAFQRAGHELCDVLGPDVPGDFVEIWWGDPQFWQWGQRKPLLRVAVALSEARSLRAEGRRRAISQLAKADMIICPSIAGSTAFKELPLDMPIHVVPFGVNPEEFHPCQRDWSGTRFGFLHGGVTQFRKGSWLVPEAFLLAFPQLPKGLTLTMASPRPSPMFLKLKQEYNGCRNIRFRSGLEDSAMVHYQSHHVYVSPHLSEGFGLCIPEAMATGMACLVARCSAPREFFSSDFGWWVEMSEEYAPVSQCLPDTAGLWRIPDVESLAKAMEDAYRNPKRTMEKGSAAAAYAKDRLTWSETCRGMMKVIEEEIDGKKGVTDNASLQRRTVARRQPSQHGAVC